MLRCKAENPGLGGKRVRQNQRQQIQAHKTIQNQGVDGAFRCNQVHAVDSERQQEQEKHGQKQTAKRFFLSTQRPGEEQPQTENPKQPMQKPGKVSGNQAVKTFRKEPSKGGVGKHCLPGEIGQPQDDTAFGILTEGNPGDFQNQLCRKEIQPQAQNQERHIGHTLQQNSAGLFAKEQLAEQV